MSPDLRSYCAPHNREPVGTSTSSAPIRNEPPLCITRPVRTARTFRSRPVACGSMAWPLNRNTVLCAMTRSFGTVARILMRLAVMPSLRYSCSGSRLALSKGKTARESMVFEGRRARSARVSSVDVRDRCSLVEDSGPAFDIAEDCEISPAARLPESNSRFNRSRSAHRSETCW